MLLSAAITGMLAVSGCAHNKADTSEATTAAEGECHGINSCKGEGDCGGKGHSCAGKNTCKGQGWKKMSEADCSEAGGEFKS